MLQETLRYLEERRAADAHFTYEIIVVDDGSRDGTCAIVEQVCAEWDRERKREDTFAFTPPTLDASQPSQFMERYNDRDGRAEVVRLLPLRTNRGKGFAVKQGMIRTRGQLALMLDSDGATDIADLVKLEEALRQVETPEGLGIALGSRAHLESTDVVKREVSLL